MLVLHVGLSLLCLSGQRGLLETHGSAYYDRSPRTSSLPRERDALIRLQIQRTTQFYSDQNRYPCSGEKYSLISLPSKTGCSELSRSRSSGSGLPDPGLSTLDSISPP